MELFGFLRQENLLKAHNLRNTFFSYICLYFRTIGEKIRTIIFVSDLTFVGTCIVIGVYLFL